MIKFVAALIADRKGISALEYGVLGGVVLVALVAAAGTLTPAINGAFTAMVGAL
jgi:pilus assembly protein Flp/PilA